eukprot:8915782-Alexandrium_andersonii.AAC.1
MARAGRGCFAAGRTTRTRTSLSSERTSTTPSRQIGTALCRADPGTVAVREAWPVSPPFTGQ